MPPIDDRDRSAHRRARRGQEEPRLRDRRPHPRRAEGRGHRVGGRARRHDMAPGMNAPLYTTEILRLAASLAEPRGAGARGRRAPSCARRPAAAGSRLRSSSTSGAGSTRISQQVHACAFGQASAALLERLARWAATRDEVARRAGRARAAGSAATTTTPEPGRGSRRSRPRARASRPPWRDPAAVPGACSRRSRPRVSDVAAPRRPRPPPRSSKAARSCSARRWCSSPCSASLKLGATLGYIVAGALIGPQVLRPDRRSGAADQRHRDRHRAAAVHRRAGAPAEPAVAAAQGHFRARPRAGRAVRTRAQPRCSTSRSAFRRKRRSPSGLPLACRRPRRCCRCCAPTMSSTRRRASAPFRSCCSRTSRSCR